MRPGIIALFSDQRLRRLARRLTYFENPYLFEEAERCIIAEDIAARRRGVGDYADPPWMTIDQALSELEAFKEEVSDAFKRGFLDLR
jgi:exodeoxyribonuclease I